MGVSLPSNTEDSLGANLIKVSVTQLSTSITGSTPYLLGISLSSVKKGIAILESNLVENVFGKSYV